MIASIVLPLCAGEAAQGLLGATLAQAFGAALTTRTVSETWTDLDTGAVFREPGLMFEVRADWTAPRLARRLELIAGDAARRAGLPCLTVTHADGKSFDVGPAEAAPRPGLSFDDMAA